MLKNLEQARKHFNEWQGNAAIFVDFEEMEAWTIVEENINYHDEHVVCIIDKDNWFERDHRYRKDQIEKLAKVKYEKFKEGWNRIELEDNFFKEFAEIIGN